MTAQLKSSVKTYIDGTLAANSDTKGGESKSGKDVCGH